jgi:hypothetical protein
MHAPASSLPTAKPPAQPAALPSSWTPASENIRTAETVALLKAAEELLSDWAVRDFSRATESGSLRGVVTRLQRARKQFDSKLFFVVVFGPLKAGKSTLTNALARTHVSPTGFGMETTIRPSMIVQSPECGIDQYFLRDRESTNSEEAFNLVADYLRGLLPAEDLDRVVVKESSPLNEAQLKKKLTEDSDSRPLITIIRVHGGKMVGHGVAIVDMPGLDGTRANSDSDPVHEWVIERADFFLFVQSSMAALNRDTKNFLERVVRKTKMPPVWLIQNVIDARHWVAEGQREQEAVKQRDFALGRVMDWLGLSDRNRPPITSLNLGLAWDGIDSANLEWEERSRFPEFEQKITSHLLSQRAVIQERNSVKGFNKALNDCETDLSGARGRIVKIRDDNRRVLATLDHCLGLVAAIDYKIGHAHLTSKTDNLADRVRDGWKNETKIAADQLKHRHNSKLTGEKLNQILGAFAAASAKKGAEAFGCGKVLDEYKGIAETVVQLAEKALVEDVNKILQEHGWTPLPPPAPPLREDLPDISDSPFSVERVQETKALLWHKTFEASAVADTIGHAQTCFESELLDRVATWKQAIALKHPDGYCGRRRKSYQSHLEVLKKQHEQRTRSDMDRAESALALIEPMLNGLRELSGSSKAAMASMGVA